MTLTMTAHVDRSTGVFSRRYRTTTIGAVALVALTAFEAIAVSTAMPTVATKLGGLTGYALAFGIPVAASIVGMVASGSMSDRRGPGPALVAGWTLFVVGLLIAGSAPTMTVFIGGRAVQGLGAGLITVALYVVVAVYAEELRPRIFSLFSSAWVVPALIGPAITGVVVQTVGWRWVFLGVPVLALGAAVLIWPELRRQSGTPTAHADGDRPTTARQLLAAVGAGVAACLLSVAGQSENHAVGGGLLVVGLLLLVVSAPRLLPAGTFAFRRGLPAVVGLRGLTSAAFVGAEVYLPLALSHLRGLSPAQSGLILTVGALGWSFGSMVQGRISTAARRPALLAGGLAAITLGITGVGFSVWSGVPLALVFVAWAICGTGMGIAYSTLSVLTLDLSEPGEAGRNSSALSVNDALVQSVALAISAAVFAALIGGSTVAAFAFAFGIAGIAAVSGTVLAHRVGVRVRG